MSVEDYHLKNQLTRNTLALASCAALTFVLVGSQANARAVPWRVDPNPPNKVTNVLNSISASSPGDVWAVGLLDNSPSNPHVLAKHWNGAAWNVVPAPYMQSWDTSEFRGVSALARNDVWAVGTFTFRAGINQQIINSSVIEHFDGVRWSIIPSPQSNPRTGSEFFLNAVSALSANDVWAVGFGSAGTNAPLLPLYEHWNGKVWTAQLGDGSPFPGDLFSVSATSPNDVWAAGSQGGETYDDTYISHWNGQKWSRVPTPNRNVQTSHNDLWSIRGIAANNAWAVGYGPVLMPNNEDQEQTLIMHWDGSTWKIVPSPNINPNAPNLGSNRLYGVTAVSATDVWAGGTWQDSGHFFERSLVEHWDGFRWSISPTPTVDPQTCKRYPSGTYDCTLNFLMSITSLPTGQVWTAGQLFHIIPNQGGFYDLGLILDRP